MAFIPLVQLSNFATHNQVLVDGEIVLKFEGTVAFLHRCASIAKDT